MGYGGAYDGARSTFSTLLCPIAFAAGCFTPVAAASAAVAWAWATAVRTAATRAVAAVARVTVARMAATRVAAAVALVTATAAPLVMASRVAARPKPRPMWGPVATTCRRRRISTLAWVRPAQQQIRRRS